MSLMSDDRQYVPATLRNRDFILDVLRDALPMTGVILEIETAQASISSILREISRSSLSNLPILIRTPAESTADAGHRGHRRGSCPSRRT